MFRVAVSNSKGQVTEIQCAGESATIGKADDNLVVLKGFTVGKRHASLHRRESGFFVEDHGGLSVTEVNGKTVDKIYGPLGPRDVIQIAGYQIKLVPPADAATPQPAAPPVVPAAATPVPKPATPAPAPAPVAPVRAEAPASASSAAPSEVSSAVSTPTPPPAAPASPAARAASPAIGEQTGSFALLSSDAKAANQARRTIHQKLIKTMDLRRVDVSRMSEDELRNSTSSLIAEILATETGLPPTVNKQRLAKEVLDEVVGLGPLEDLLGDASVSEIMVNRYDQIYVERSGKLRLSEVTFTSEKSVVSAIERIVAPLGRRIDESSPMVDARLKDGSRVNAMIPPLALKGANITIRKFSKSKLRDDDLIRYGSITRPMMDFMQQAVLHASNIVISGGTGSGKTTLLNVLSNYIPEDERIITIEDAAELQLAQPHVVSLEARPANVEGKGAVHIRDLVKNCLRMRPDRIVVGECRGGEALDMLQAMNTGHDGSLTTAHANTPRDCLARLEVMTLMSGLDLPVRAIREQIASAVHVIIQQSRFPDGSRKVTHITEVTGMEGEMIQLQDIFLFKQEGYGADGKIRGRFVATGNIPELYQSLAERGIEVDLSLFKKDAAL
jgi:pilus assembly protein CpaF